MRTVADHSCQALTVELSEKTLVVFVSDSHIGDVPLVE